MALFESSPVEVQAEGNLIAGAEEVVESVAVEVADRDASTVVDKFAFADVERIVAGDLVAEIGTGSSRVEQLEAGAGGGAAGAENDNQTE